MSDWNAKIIKEFRENGGKVGGQFEGAPLLLLHHKGRKTGREYVSPVMYQEVDGGVAVFASKGGAPSDPDWYRNVLEDPQVEAEIGTETLGFRAREAKGAEREQIWTKQKQDWPGFADYEEKTEGIREIPVVILERAA